MAFSKRTVNYLRVLAFFCTIGSIYLFAPWYAGYTYIKPLPDTVKEEVADAINHDFDGIIVYVDQGDKTPEYYAAGWKNRENKVPADPRSLFKIGSHRKLFIASAITRLAYNNRLTLDNTVADYFPELVGQIENVEAISIRHLVQHRSGIPNITDTPGFWEKEHENEDAVLELIFNQPAHFAPGSDYEYSNTNYLLLTKLIDKIVGYSHRQYIAEAIIEPLGLENTYMSIDDVNLDDVMSGYYVGVEEDIKSVNYGTMLATAEDLGVFLRALNDGSLFNDEEQAIYSSLYFYEHTGLVPGYQSFSKFYRDIDTVVVQFVNTTNFSGNTWIMADVVFKRIEKILRKQ